ncbi:MAG: CoA activase [Firmicutes bacterium]|nr:CoA activase [Bacillota bacterium]
MITAGFDVGNKFTKVVLLKDGEIAGCGRVLSGFNQKQAIEKALEQALSTANLEKTDIYLAIATGAGKADVTFAGGTITEVRAAAKGTIKLFPKARTVIDVGSEEGRALTMDEAGNVIEFALNEKCAAGAGSFIETISQTLEVPLEEMGTLALKANKSVPINAQCVVFAESEVISLIHAQTPKADISNSIHEALADRISAMARRAGLQREVAAIGGLAKNPGFIQALENNLGTKILLPDNPDLVSALGAALYAAEKANNL